ncbi:MAG: ribonuclease HII [Thermoplasmata archaeon]
MITCGVDEAGRGPVIGPLVICGLCADDVLLKELNVRDSKLLSPSRREKLYPEILKIANSYKIEMLKAEQIDELRKTMSLNEIEAMYFAKVISSLEGEIFIVDAADVDENRFAKTIKKYLDKNVNIISKHKADRDYPLVSAASIIAKVTRDREIEKIKDEIGDFGSGYPADPKTINFITQYYNKYGILPPYVRKSWKTLKNLITLDNYLDGDNYERTL